MNLVLSNYFTTKKDPQRNKNWDTDNYGLISGWYESIIKLNLKGIIFYDSLSENFINKYSLENISFIKYIPNSLFTLNDERFICWLEFLKKNNNIEKVFTTDLFDVKFIRNPFDLFDEKYKIYADKLNILIRNNKNRVHQMLMLYGKVYFGNEWLINAGVIGGKRNDIIFLFQNMINDFKEGINGNVPILNKNIYSLFDKSELMLGYPVVSKFKKYEKDGNFAIIHK